MTDVSFGPWRKLAERVYVTVAQPASTNVILVVGDDHALLIDPGATPEQGRALAASASEVAGRRVDRVLITHGHWDHFFGLAGVGEVESYGHETLADAFGWDSNRAAMVDLGLGRDDLALPTQPFSLIRGVFLGGIHAEAMHTSPGHTPGDLVVLIPEANVVVMGDLIERDPQIDDQSSLQTWPKAIDAGLGAADDDTILIPGHGEVVDNVFVVNQRNHIEALLNQADYLAGEGVTLEQALAQIDDDLAREVWPPLNPATIATALPYAYAQLERDGRLARPSGKQLPIIKRPA